jgi:urease subunit beta
MIPGEILLGSDPVAVGGAGELVELTVVNTGDRPIQVGAHYHLAAANPALSMDREAAWGRRPAIPAGTSVRFEPGIERVVRLLPLRGNRIVPGLRPEWAGPLDSGRGNP